MREISDPAPPPHAQKYTFVTEKQPLTHI